MTTLAGHYGSDNQKNRFPVPGLKGTKSNNEKYFVLVDKKTGEKKIYNENFGSDTLVGSVGASGKFEGASGAKAEEINAFSNNELASCQLRFPELIYPMYVSLLARRLCQAANDLGLLFSKKARVFE